MWCTLTQGWSVSPQETLLRCCRASLAYQLLIFRIYPLVACSRHMNPTKKSHQTATALNSANGMPLHDRKISNGRKGELPTPYIWNQRRRNHLKIRTDLGPEREETHTFYQVTTVRLIRNPQTTNALTKILKTLKRRLTESYLNNKVDHLMLGHGVHAANMFPLVTLVSFLSIPAALTQVPSILLLRGTIVNRTYLWCT